MNITDSWNQWSLAANSMEDRFSKLMPLFFKGIPEADVEKICEAMRVVSGQVIAFNKAMVEITSQYLTKEADLGKDQ